MLIKDFNNMNTLIIASHARQQSLHIIHSINTIDCALSTDLLSLIERCCNIIQAIFHVNSISAIVFSLTIDMLLDVNQYFHVYYIISRVMLRVIEHNKAGKDLCAIEE